jgi:hypothetical protein
MKVKKIGAHPTLSVVKNGNVTQKKGKPKMFNGEPAVVRVSMGTTLNMGNYQSLRLGVDLALPCSPAQVEQAFDKAAKFVQLKLDTLITEHTPQNVGVKEIGDVEL